MVFTPPSLRPRSNVAILNAIRGEASNAYQSSVPAATKANLEDSMANIFNYTPNRNEFIDALLNKVGRTIGTYQIWTNPLSIFKQGMLPYGESIEEVAFGLAKAKTYDPNRNSLERDVFGQEANDVAVAYHKVNRREKFKVTINEPELRQAFTSGDNGLFDFVSGLMSQATNADELNEFYTTTALFAEYYRNSGFFKVNVPDLLAIDADEPDAKTFLKTVRAYAGTLSFPSRHYNAAHMPRFARPEDLVLFITPEALASIDVDGLAAAFNIDKAQMPSRTIIIPQEQFGIPGAQAILTTDDFFVIADKLIETRQLENPDGLYTNHWLHHWSVISASPFAPAILLTTEPGDTIDVAETPVTGVNAIQIADSFGQLVTSPFNVQRGQTYTVFSDATTSPTGGVNDAVRYELVSKTNGPKSVRTRVNQNGTLSVSIDETSTVLTINAYPTDTANATIKATLDLPVVGTRGHIWPTNADVDSDNDGLFEIVPDAPTRVGNVVTVPSTHADSIQYKKAGTNVAAGSSSTITTGDTVYTATAKTGFELASGATASWTFTV